MLTSGYVERLWTIFTKHPELWAKLSGEELKFVLELKDQLPARKGQARIGNTRVEAPNHS